MKTITRWICVPLFAVLIGCTSKPTGVWDQKLAEAKNANTEAAWRKLAEEAFEKKNEEVFKSAATGLYQLTKASPLLNNVKNAEEFIPIYRQGLMNRKELQKTKSVNDLKIIAIAEMEYIDKHGVYGTLEELVKFSRDVEELKDGKLSSAGWTFKIVLSSDRKTFCTVAKPAGDGEWLYGDSEGKVESLPPFEVDPQTCKIRK